MPDTISVKFTIEAWDKLEEELFPNHLAHCSKCDVVTYVGFLDIDLVCESCRLDLTRA